MICYYVLVLIMVLDSVTCISFPTYSSTGPTPLAGWMSNPTTVAHPAVSGGAIGLGAPSISVWDLSACSMPFQATLVKDPGVSVNRVIWSPDGALFGKSFLILRDFVIYTLSMAGMKSNSIWRLMLMSVELILELVSLLLQVQDLGYHLEFLHTCTILVYGLLKYCGWDVPVRNIFSCTDSVETLMSETHELGGSAVVRNCEDDLVYCLVVEVKEMLVKGFRMKYLLFRVFCVKFSGDESYVISGRDDTNLRIWKAKASKQLGIFSCFLYNLDLGEVINV
ncbi:hypothetical protein V8G54_016760 [Vigna mungo]|uniref:Uncharacterized protein n=1 Tax=Vigna mungo TaxID=3915 RepID=A0AAQ3NM17_VIGMU